MFKFLLKDSVINHIVEKITSEIKSSLNLVQEQQDKKLDVVVEHLEKLRLELNSLDQRLTQKELRDKAEYGQMRYQINSLQADLRPKSKAKTPDKSH